MAQRVLRGSYDLAIIGGGVVGLATARQVLLNNPKLRVCVLEKDKQLASHQSKRNSGVVHCGIYYKKGSLKSKFCIKGAGLIKEYCRNKGLPYDQCGKLIVATHKDELGTLHDLFENAKSNQIEGIELITKERVEEIQPGCNTAIEAIWSPNTAIVDWQKIALSYAEEFKQLGGTIITEFNPYFFEPRDKNLDLVNMESPDRSDRVEAKSVVICAGVFSDYFARRTCNNEHPKVVPFKGNYFMLDERLASTIKTNIYPVPNPKVPFLGVHITPRLDGSVLIGPTSILTLGYERYDPIEPLNFAQVYHILWRSGLTRMLRKKDYFKAGLMELWRLASKDKVASDVRKFLPELKTSDLIDTKFCGIRAQAVDKDGQLVDDFLFEYGVLPQFKKVLHVRNCPSPAATSSLAIAERIVQQIEGRLI